MKMKMKNGVIPTALGAVVTTGAIALRAQSVMKKGMSKKQILPMVETAAIGFGLAHIVLGSIDLYQNKK